MSTGVSDHQRSKGQGNTSKAYNKFPNGPKDHHNAEHEDVDSWRNQPQQQHHQGYSSSMAANSDPYMQSYYAPSSFQYPTYSVNEGGPWSSNGGEVAFLGGGYPSSGMHDAGAAPAHYDSMFGAGNGGSFGNFGGQAQAGHGFNYGFHGNGDYNTWGQPQQRKPYDDYYRDGMYGDDRGVKMMEHSMGSLSLGNDKEHGLKDLKEMMQQGGGGGGKKTTWASIASQPAKPQSNLKKKAGMPLPPIIPGGTWENKNGSIPKAPIVAPVQAPHPPAWERAKPPPPSAPQQPQPSQGMSGMQGPPLREMNNRNQHYQQQQLHGQPPSNYMNSQSHPPPSLMQSHSHSQVPSRTTNNHRERNVEAPPPPAPVEQMPPQPKYPDELKMKNDYNPPEFDLNAEGARFFVIKSYSEDDIHRSIKYEIWCSTERGNYTLDQAFREREGQGPVFLFFSVNGSGHFCGMAQMMSAVDYNASSSVWCQDKWKGQFKVKWIYVKDVSNTALRHIRLENNENKPVTNSRDTQEVPFEKGKLVLKILHSYQHTTSIFDDFIHYEKRQEEEDQRRQTQQTTMPSNDRPERNERGGGGERGGRGHHHQPYNERGHGGSNHYQQRDNNRDFNFRDNPRDSRDHRDGDRDGQGRRDMNDRGGPDRGDHYGRGYDRGDFQQRDRDHRGGRGGGRGMSRH